MRERNTDREGFIFLTSKIFVLVFWALVSSQFVFAENVAGEEGNNDNEGLPQREYHNCGWLRNNDDDSRIYERSHNCKRFCVFCGFEAEY